MNDSALDQRLTQLRADYFKWALANPELARPLEGDLLKMAGLERYQMVDVASGFDFSFMKVGIDDLADCSTACGRLPNRPFGAAVLKLLRDNKVTAILFLGRNSDPLDRPMTGPVMQAAAMHLSAKTHDRWYSPASQFARLITEAHGSLRADPASIRGWSCFESE